MKSQMLKWTLCRKCSDFRRQEEGRIGGVETPRGGIQGNFREHIQAAPKRLELLPIDPSLRPQRLQFYHQRQ